MCCSPFLPSCHSKKWDQLWWKSNHVSDAIICPTYDTWQSTAVKLLPLLAEIICVVISFGAQLGQQSVPGAVAPFRDPSGNAEVLQAILWDAVTVDVCSSELYTILDVFNLPRECSACGCGMSAGCLLGPLPGHIFGQYMWWHAVLQRHTCSTEAVWSFLQLECRIAKGRY